MAGTSGLLLVAAVIGFAGGTAVAAGGATVTIGTTLSPKAITVAPGTTVTWHNADHTRHRVRSTSGPAELDSGNLEAGQSWSVAFTAAGTYSYLDDRNKDNHAYHGTVTVRAGATGGGTGTTPKPPVTAAVSIAGEAYHPASVSVAVGGTVTWTNNDSMSHTVTADAGTFASAILSPGQKFVFRFTKAGTYAYHCQLHSNMHGTVLVPTTTGSVPPPTPPKPPPTTRPGGPAQPPTVPAAPGKPGKHAVSISDAGFSPANLPARAGDTVTWVNHGTMPHTVTAVGGAFDHTISPGGSFSTVLRTQGTIHYACTFHPFMTGTIVVGAPLPGVHVPPAGPAQANAAAAPALGGPAPAATGKAQTYQVQIKDFSFSPATVNARVGDTISWVNAGKMPHTVTAKGGAFDQQLAPGQRYNYVLRTQGTISYVCTYHAQMVGTIVVGAALAGVAVPPALSSRVAGSPPAAGAPAPAVAGQVKTYEIQVKDMAFAPAMQNARVGDTISWVNVGKIPHTVTAKNHLFDATLSPGQRFNLVLRKQGDIDYVCSYHSVMVGMLHVGPALAGVKVPAAGAGSSGAARNVAAISPLGLAGLGTGWLLVIGLLAAAQLRARITNLAGAAALRMQVPSPDPS